MYYIYVNSKKIDEVFTSLESARETAREMVVGCEDEIEIMGEDGKWIYRYWENIDTCADYEEKHGGGVVCLNACSEAGLTGFEDWD